MAIIYGGPTPPAAATYAGAAGDIFVSSADVQFRFQLTPTRLWTQIVPSAAARTTISDTRADVVPPGGQLNDRLAKTDDTSWALGWANAAEGVMMTWQQTTPARIWSVTHNLGSRFVGVTVISPGATNLLVPQITIIPDIEYSGAMNCELLFAKPMVGTAIIRR